MLSIRYKWDRPSRACCRLNSYIQVDRKQPSPWSLYMPNSRIVNLTNGCRFKRGYVERALDACAVEWVEMGVSIRNLTPQESIIARNTRARLLEPMPYAELPGIRFDPPSHGIPATRRENILVWEAQNFFAGVRGMQ